MTVRTVLSSPDPSFTWVDVVNPARKELGEIARRYGLLSIQLALASHRTNDVVRVLTVFSVFFLPLTFLVGIYGMNFQFMAELHERWGYPAVMAAMGLVTLIIFLWFRKRGWLRG